MPRGDYAEAVTPTIAAAPSGAMILVDVDTWWAYCVHMNVGVRELKQHLSEYLDRAAAGEAIVVTERGVPKVQLVAIPGSNQLERGIDEGWLRAPTRTPGLGAVKRVSSPRRVLDVLAEDRDA